MLYGIMHYQSRAHWMLDADPDCVHAHAHIIARLLKNLCGAMPTIHLDRNVQWCSSEVHRQANK